MSFLSHTMFRNISWLSPSWLELFLFLSFLSLSVSMILFGITLLAVRVKHLAMLPHIVSKISLSGIVLLDASMMLSSILYFFNAVSNLSLNCFHRSVVILSYWYIVLVCDFKRCCVILLFLIACCVLRVQAVILWSLSVRCRDSTILLLCVRSELLLSIHMKSILF